VNTRLQVEHPVSEEVTGLDLVREMFRIADGGELGPWPDGSTGDPPLRGHAIEFRINAEDPARGFLPAPGTITAWQPPSGPGVRLDAGYVAGDTVPQAYDSLLGKLIVTGATRTQALERSRRALAEFTVAGMPTVLPFHRAVVSDPAFTGPEFGVHTRWIETEFSAPLEPQSPAEPSGSPLGSPSGSPSGSPDSGAARSRLTVEVGGKRLEVTVPAVFGVPGGTPSSSSSSERITPARSSSRRSRSGGGADKATGDSLVTPMQGTIVKIVADEGAAVSAGDTVVILEAMKMEQPLAAHKDGIVTGLSVSVGQTVTADTVLCKIEG
jgi:acetyl-CoA/propionyl-CoA carboxylase biotin carboxyl carrier protein